MAFYVNGIEPTKINVVKNGVTTELTALGTSTTMVWGKPFQLIFNKGLHTTITVTRTSSPNEQASIGVITDGITVYYGDELTITMQADSGYNLTVSTITMGGVVVSSPITVSNDVTIVTQAEQSAPSWKTIFQGALQKGGVSRSATTITYTITAGELGKPSIVTSLPTRITGYALLNGTQVSSFAQQSITTTEFTRLWAVSPVFSDCQLGSPINIRHQITTSTRTTAYTVITKVEQYY